MVDTSRVWRPLGWRVGEKTWGGLASCVLFTLIFVDVLKNVLDIWSEKMSPPIRLVLLLVWCCFFLHVSLVFMFFDGWIWKKNTGNICQVRDVSWSFPKGGKLTLPPVWMVDQKSLPTDFPSSSGLSGGGRVRGGGWLASEAVKICTDLGAEISYPVDGLEVNKNH